jgi:DNA replication protein DnaC
MKDNMTASPRFTLKELPAEQLEGWIKVLKQNIQKSCSSIGREYKPLHESILKELALYAIRDKSFKGNLNKGILIIGDVGSGKTFVMEAFCKLLCAMHRTPVFETSSRDIAKKYRKGSETMFSLEDEISRSPIMFIDDLADEVDSSKVFGTEIFVGYEVLSTRYDVWINEGFITLATSNLDRKNLLLKYGKRIDSRIEQMFNVVVLDGIDLRKV